MESINEVIERLAANVMSADPTDLPLLAQLHSHFQEVERLATEQGEKGGGTSIGEAAASAEKLLERIILREVEDAEKSLQRVAATVSDIQRMLQGGPPAPAAAATPEQPTANPGQEKDAAASAERTIGADDVALVQEFISEAQGHLDTAEAELLKVEESPDNLEAVNAIFRSFHTIKGVAGFLNLQQIGALAHNAEGLLDQARKGQLVLSGESVDTVLAAIDCMKSLIGALEQAVAQGTPIPQETKLPALLARIQSHLTGKPPAGGQPAAHAPPAPATAPATPAPTAETPAPAASTPSSAPAAQAKAAAPAAPNHEPAAATEHAAQHPGEHKPAEHKEGAEHPAGKTGGTGATADATVKVATDRLDNLINMVGELVIAQAMVAQDLTSAANGDQRLQRNMAHLGKITRELQDLSMSMRMVPIQGVFQKMARLVRDLARKACKQIDLVVVGGETELDRNVVEAISDPLVHMVRNAADHGIELPEERSKAGKPPVGRIQLKASHQAGNIVIEISDDGKGLNKQKIMRKAIEAGIVREGQDLSEQEIFRLIFHAGLSTADRITDVSGRGVGMDVVRKNVEALRGRIDIASVEGQGSTFTIRLPLTLAVIDGLVVRVGPDRYIIPITSIEQSIRPKPDQLSTVQNQGEMCMVRGNLLPLFRLYRLFNVKPRTEDPTESLVVIVQHDQSRCCLLVDELLGQQQVVIKSLGESIGAVRGISGGAILGDGAVSLILDVPGLVDLACHD